MDPASSNAPGIRKAPLGDLLRAYIATDLNSGQPEEDITDTDDLVLRGYLNSHGLLLLVGFVEQTFHIEVPVDDITRDNFRSIAGILRYAIARSEEGLSHHDE